MTDIPYTPAARRIRWSVVADHAVLIAGSLFLLIPLLVMLQTTTTTDLETISSTTISAPPCSRLRAFPARTPGCRC